MTSYWNESYWLMHCEGYSVWDGAAPIGYVEDVLVTDRGEAHALIVRVGTSFTRFLSIPVEAVQDVDPAGERVFAALTERARPEPRQLPIPALAHAG